RLLQEGCRDRCDCSVYERREQGRSALEAIARLSRFQGRARWPAKECRSACFCSHVSIASVAYVQTPTPLPSLGQPLLATCWQTCLDQQARTGISNRSRQS